MTLSHLNVYLFHYNLIYGTLKLCISSYL